MPIMLYPKCWRDRTDCQPIHCIDGTNEPITEEQAMTLDYTPDSFVCSGVIASDRRGIQQDCYRLCFKNAVVDDMSDNDIQDLAHVVNVASAALALHMARDIKQGFTEVPTVQGAPTKGDNAAHLA